MKSYIAVVGMPGSGKEELVRIAVERGYQVRLCDPHVTADTPGLPAPIMPIEQAVRDADAVVLLVDHSAFNNLDVDLVGALVRSKRILDTRAALDTRAWARGGFDVSVLGNGAMRANLSASAVPSGSS